MQPMLAKESAKSLAIYVWSTVTVLPTHFGSSFANFFNFFGLATVDLAEDLADLTLAASATQTSIDWLSTNIGGIVAVPDAPLATDIKISIGDPTASVGDTNFQIK